jgi:ABC-type branched-subunit amino acid transport system ATPase component
MIPNDGTRTAALHGDFGRSFVFDEPAPRLIGESGCGRSAIGRMVAGMPPPSEGEVRYHGRNIAALPAHAAKRTTLKPR